MRLGSPHWPEGEPVNPGGQRAYTADDRRGGIQGCPETGKRDGRSVPAPRLAVPIKREAACD
jgi:hypothetical protein